MTEFFEEILGKVKDYLVYFELFEEIGKPNPQLKKDKQALSDFLQNFYWGEMLSVEQAKANLRSGVLELVDNYGRHRSNGLLLTQNGYFLTNYHCVEDKIDNLQVVTESGGVYQVLKICGHNKKNDTALVKADIPGKAEALRYKFAPKPDLAIHIPIVMLMREHGKCKIKGGFIHRPKFKEVKVEYRDRTFVNQIELNLDGVPGDSGSVISTEDGKIYGITCTGATKDDGKKIYSSSCTFWVQALGIVSAVVNS